MRLANGARHRPDLISIPAGSTAEQWNRTVPTTAIEVELVQKAKRRLDRFVAGRFGALHYYCSEEAMPYVQRPAALFYWVALRMGRDPCLSCLEPL